MKVNLPVLNMELRAVLKSLAADIASGVLDGTRIANLNADNINAGIITGRTLRTSEPGTGTGSGVVIEGGNDKIIKLYYNADNVATISGLKTAYGTETEYLKLYGSSGRFIGIRESQIKIDGDVVPNATNAIGTASNAWNEVWAKKVIAWGNGSPARFSCNGSDGTDFNGVEFTTSIRVNSSNMLQRKGRALTFVGGIVTAVSSESGWYDIHQF